MEFIANKLQIKIKLLNVTRAGSDNVMRDKSLLIALLTSLLISICFLRIYTNIFLFSAYLHILCTHFYAFCVSYARINIRGLVKGHNWLMTYVLHMKKQETRFIIFSALCDLQASRVLFEIQKEPFSSATKPSTLFTKRDFNLQCQIHGSLSSF